MAATLDGVVEQTGAVFEAKYMLPWAFTEEGAADIVEGLRLSNAASIEFH
ncbi:hypothetical protein ACVWZW_000230 [Bradyrhizobium sp. F1.13.4]